MTGEVQPAFQVACRVDGVIQVYFVGDVPDFITAIEAVRLQVPGARPIVAVLNGAGNATIRKGKA